MAVRTTSSFLLPVNARGNGCSVLFVLTVLLNESLGRELLDSLMILLTSLRTRRVALARLASSRTPASDFSTSLKAALLGLDEKPSGERGGSSGF